MVEILLVRHGETAWNVSEIFRGRADVALNEIGMEQARLLGEYLAGVKIGAVYSSPLQRATKTAEAVAGQQGLKVSVVRGLIDFGYGEWQGLSREEVEVRYHEIYADWTGHPERLRVPGGESLEDVRERAMAVVYEAVRKQDAERVALVSHRVVNKVLICAMLGLDNSHFWNIRLDTCAITSFNYEAGRFILTRHNDTSFLKPVLKTPLNDF